MVIDDQHFAVRQGEDVLFLEAVALDGIDPITDLGTGRRRFVLRAYCNVAGQEDDRPQNYH
jgi:hypothetical protein